MLISVAICTWNRARPLDRTLASLEAAVTATSSAVEVLVVDNNSTDRTREIVEKHASRLPIRYVFEAEGGLSYARNRAVHAAQGSYIAWIDDDVTVLPDWLLAYERAVDEQPDACFFGGPIEAVLEGRPPRWLASALPTMPHLFSAIDPDQRPLSITRARDLPYGANYMVRMQEHRTHRYVPELGRQPGAYWLAGEESALLRDLLEQGGRGRWVPDARVEHHIHRDRQTLRYIVAHGLGSGRTLLRVRPSPYRNRRGWPGWMWRRYFLLLARSARACLGAEPRKWVPAVHEACVATGFMVDGLRARPETVTGDEAIAGKG